MIKIFKKNDSKLDSTTDDHGFTEAGKVKSKTTSISLEAIKCKKILELDQSIRFAGMCTPDGKLLAAEYREQVDPLLTYRELEFSAISSTIRALERNMMTEVKLGRVVYSVSAYENVKRATFSLDVDKFLLVSFERNASDDYIVGKIMAKINTFDHLIP